jgi:hypothetical protein
MNDKIQLVITCRFAPWSQGENKYPAFGHKYLITVPLMTENVEGIFKELFKEKIGHEFDGEILFVEEVDYCSLN